MPAILYSLRQSAATRTCSPGRSRLRPRSSRRLLTKLLWLSRRPMPARPAAVPAFPPGLKSAAKLLLPSSRERCLPGNRPLSSLKRCPSRAASGSFDVPCARQLSHVHHHCYISFLPKKARCVCTQAKVNLPKSSPCARTAGEADASEPELANQPPSEDLGSRSTETHDHRVHRILRSPLKHSCLP